MLTKEQFETIKQESFRAGISDLIQLSKVVDLSVCDKPYTVEINTSMHKDEGAVCIDIRDFDSDEDSFVCGYWLTELEFRNLSLEGFLELLDELCRKENLYA